MSQPLEEKLRQIVVEHMDSDPAHDLSHIERVVKMSLYLADFEKDVDLEVLVPAAWLHDIVSFAKNTEKRKRSSQEAAMYATSLLEKLGVDLNLLPQIAHAIEAHSFSANIEPRSIEAKLLQDADRLDALGAHGLVRCLQVGTQLGLKLYDPEDPFALNRVLNDKMFTLDHFELKLLKLGERMHTKEASRLAEKRVMFLKLFLNQLNEEIEVVRTETSNQSSCSL
jgi:uncharacterized protein